MVENTTTTGVYVNGAGFILFSSSPQIPSIVDHVVRLATVSIQCRKTAPQIQKAMQSGYDDHNQDERQKNKSLSRDFPTRTSSLLIPMREDGKM